MPPRQKLFIRIAGITGAIAVVTGAFGAHGLETRLEAEMLEIWETAVKYHFYHVIALFALALAPQAVWDSPWAARAGWTFLFGIAVFSGTLYALALSGIGWLGAITPIGGVGLILGWVFAAFAIPRDR